MTKIVKFGGSSLADAGQFRKVAEIIKADPDRRYVVPSAPGKRYSGDTKVTDMLYFCYSLAENDEPYELELEQIKDRYTSIAEELGLKTNLNAEFDIIKKNFGAKCGSDYAASRGEYLNGMLLAEYLGFEFVNSAEVIFFNDNGEFDPKSTYPVLAERLKDVKYAVIPGFFGSKHDGTVKTFSRGGSDITGSIVAAAVKADLYENWTDVSGFLVTDPHIVPDAVPIETITYREMRELSYMGATVLHEEAIFPLRQFGIPVNVRNTNDPEAPGTMIVESTCIKPHYTITGIGGKKGFASITIEKALMNSEIGFGRKVLQVFEENGLSFEHTPSGIDTFTVYVSQKEFSPKEQNIISGLHKAVNPDLIELESDLALIAVVGRGMKRNRGTAGRIFAALAHARVNVKMIDQGSSELNIIIGVENADFEKAIQAIYDIFVETAQ